MTKDIFTLDQMLMHASQLKKKQFKPGFDHMTSDAAAIWLHVNGDQLLKSLYDGAYQPMPALGFITAKKDGGYRPLSRQTAIDTVIQQCIISWLTDICEAQFSSSSYAYRRNMGVNGALEAYTRLGSTHAWAAKVDPRQCFDTLDHEVLTSALRAFVPDEDLLRLIMRYAAQPLLQDEEIVYRSEGILQGAPLSPLLCNIYFHSLDLLLTERGISFIRYADDIVLFAENRAEAEAFRKLTEKHLTETLRLTLNPQKSAIDSPKALHFLGHRFLEEKDGLLVLRPEDTPLDAYRDWYATRPSGTRRAVTLLSDGVLRPKDFSILFDTETVDTNIPTRTTDMINIYSDVVFDSHFLKRAFDNAIQVNVFDHHGKLLGRFLPNTALKNPVVTFEQLQAYYDGAHRLTLARCFVLAALHNLRLNLRYARKHEPLALYDSVIGKLVALECKIKQCESYEELLTLEAQSRKEYYSCFDHLIHSDQFVFSERTRRPPRNEVNSLLSFGNTVLYNHISFKVNRSPLDIRVGFLHATNSRPESLNLDIAEIFKPLVVDRVIFTLLNNRQLTPRDFLHPSNGAVTLSQDAKRVFLRAFYEKLDTTLTDHDRTVSYDMLIDDEIRKLVRHFREGSPYKPFKQVR